MGDSRKYAYHTMDSFHSLTTPSRQNFQNVLSPDASGFPVQRPPPPPWPRNSKKLSMVWYGYFLELPTISCFPSTTLQLLFRVVVSLQ